MILVTGATGYLGSNLVLHILKSGKKVRACKREGSEIPEPLVPFQGSLEWVEADLLDIISLELALDGIDQVYHCAGQMNDTSLSSREVLKVWVEGSANLIDLCLEVKIRKLVFISSSVTLSIPDKNHTESVSLLKEFNNSHSSYVFGKIEAEKEAWRGIMEGLPVIIVNPGLILPKWEERPNPHLSKLYTFGSDYYTLSEFGFIEMGDLVECLVDLMDSDQKDKQFPICSEVVRQLDFIAHINSRIPVPEPHKLYRRPIFRLISPSKRENRKNTLGAIEELLKMPEAKYPLEATRSNPITGKVYKTLTQLF